MCLSGLSGCVPYQQFHTEPEQYLSVLETPADGVTVDLSVIEFDEFGMFWDLSQLEAVLERIEQRNAESKNGVLVAIYVHGWQNNADPDHADNDLRQFSDSLQRLATDLDTAGPTSPDHVVAVYIGWRGVTTRAPLLSTFTFWDRRRGGERVASYGVREAFIRITNAAKSRPDSKVLITGHSMGGMIVGLALGPSLETLVLAHGENGFRLLADGVHMLNPALDAMPTAQLIDVMKRRGVVAELRHADGRVEPSPGPVLVSITSEADDVTKTAYRLGQWIDHTSIDKRRIRDENWPSQTELSTRATGHLPFLTSHRAFIRDGEVVIEPVQDAWNDTPYWIVSVSADICKDHSDIRNVRMSALREQLLGLNGIYDTDVQTWLRTTK